MSDKPTLLDYRTPRRKPSMRAYERNGWIGLGITLALCAVAVAWWIIHKG